MRTQAVNCANHCDCLLPAIGGYTDVREAERGGSWATPANYVASCDMWRTSRSVLILRRTTDSHATYYRGYNARRKVMTSGWRDHPPVAR
jgi:hypothetical protein